MRLLLVLTVLIAVTMLLWGSWQWGRRPFYLAVAAVLAGAIALGFGIWYDEQHDQLRLPGDDIALTLTSTHESESGVRLVGTLFNNGPQDVAALTLEAQALDCPELAQCQVFYRERLTLQLYLPSGQQYPFAVVSRHPNDSRAVDRWQLQVIDKLAYPEKSR